MKESEWDQIPTPTFTGLGDLWKMTQLSCPHCPHLQNGKKYKTYTKSENQDS